MKKFFELVKKEWLRLGLDKTWYYFAPLLIILILSSIYG